MTNLTTVEQIAALIRRVETTDEMNEVIEIVKEQRNRNARTLALTFSPGDPVEFDAKGVVQKGTVIRLLKKNVKVRVEKKLPGGATYPVEWTVYPGLLRPVEEVAR